MPLNTNQPTGQYITYLPAVLQEDQILQQFLLGFEQVLSGFETEPQAAAIVTPETTSPPGLESILDNIHLYFNPQETPSEFLPWLAGWVGLSLKDEWDVRVKREFIRQVISLYQLRGTKIGLEKVLALYLKNSGFGDKVKVYEHFEHLPHYFQVQLTLPDRDPEKYWRQARIAKAIIDQEKPAHTYYTLKILVPTMQITKDVHQYFDFTLLAPPQNRVFNLTVTITPDAENPEKDLKWIAQQLKIRLDNEVESLSFPIRKMVIQDNSFALNFQVKHRQFLKSLDGFKLTLSNQTDSKFIGAIAVDVTYKLNRQNVTNRIYSEQLNLNPVLRLLNPEDNKGSSVIYGDRDPAGLMITDAIEAEPIPFSLFEDPENQTFTVDTRIIVESAVETIKQNDETIEQPAEITRNLMFKLGATVLEQNSNSYLLSTRPNIENNVLSFRKSVTHEQFLQTIEGYQLRLKNLSLKQLSGRVEIDVSLKLNHETITHRIVTKPFNLAALGAYDRMQICQRNEAGEIIAGNTILGTTSQAI